VNVAAKTWVLPPILVAMAVFALAGCEQSALESPNNEKGLTNNSEPRSADAVPPGYHEIQPHLFAKPLVAMQEGELSGVAFEKVSDCGIKFTNFISRAITNKFVETGSGVALGDYNNDGLVDVYLTGSDVANRLYKNLGGFQFEDVTDSAGVDGRIGDEITWSSGASFADIDNDGDLDLYVCGMNAPNLLYINQNDGTFKEQTNLRGAGYVGASKQASFCDYDRDGDLDFYLLTYQDDDLTKGKPYFRKIDGRDEVIPGNENDVQVIDGFKTKAMERFAN